LSTVEGILKHIKGENFEIVVYDNSDEEILGTKLRQKIEDERVRYFYDSSEMAIVNNFNKSLSKASGEYICFIGDDDSVHPEILNIANWANQNGYESVIGSNSIYYEWPYGEVDGKLTIYPHFNAFKEINLESELIKFSKEGAVYYLNHDLSKIYHGLVKKGCMDNVYNKTGSFFNGLTPDSYGAIALSNVVKKAIRIDFPISIAGTCFEAKSTHKTEEARKRKLKDAPHFKGRGGYNWSDQVPMVYSGETVWAESAICALQLMGRDDLISLVNHYKMCAHISIAVPHLEEKVLNDFLFKKERGKRIPVLLKYYFVKLKIRTKKVLEKALNRIKKLLNRKTSIQEHGIQDMNTCLEIINGLKSQQNPSFLEQNNYTTIK